VELLTFGCGDEGEVAHAGDPPLASDGVHDPEAYDFGQGVVTLEETLDASDLDENGPSVGGDGEAEAQ
jgi:hypothetical protein